MGIGAMLRHTAGAITVYVAILLVSFLILAALPSSWQHDVSKFLPEVLTESMRAAIGPRLHRLLSARLDARARGLRRRHLPRRCGAAGAPRCLSGPLVTASSPVSLWPAITSEWIKFRSLRSTRYALLFTVVLSVGISALLCFAERQQWPMQDAPTHLSFDPTATSLSGFFLAEIAIGVIGVLIMSSEYSSGSIRSTLAATPGRAIVLCAKAVVLFCSILVVAEICSFASFVIGQAILNGVTPTASLSDPTVLRAVVLSGLSLALLALLALGIATMLRHTAGSITVFVCLTLVLFLIVLALPTLVGRARLQVPARDPHGLDAIDHLVAVHDRAVRRSVLARRLVVGPRELRGRLAGRGRDPADASRRLISRRSWARRRAPGRRVPRGTRRRTCRRGRSARPTRRDARPRWRRCRQSCDLGLEVVGVHVEVHARRRLTDVLEEPLDSPEPTCERSVLGVLGADARRR